MSQNKNKIYVKGNAKEIGTFGTIQASINVNQLQEYADQKGYVKVLIQKKRETDQYGNTHFIVIDQGPQ